MGYFIAVGVLALAVGFLFLFAPGFLNTLNIRSARLVTSFETKAFTYRVGLGISLVIASILFFFVAYYIRVRG